MISEVITGLLTRTDAAAADFPVGILAVGTANAMANYIDRGAAKGDNVKLWTNARYSLAAVHQSCSLTVAVTFLTLYSTAICTGHAERIDVIEIITSTYIK